MLKKKLIFNFMNHLKLLCSKITHEDFKILDKYDSSNSSLIYGEVYNEDLYNVLLKYINNESNMLDVGSGCGKLSIYLALKLDIYVEGIEITENRFIKSEKLLEYFNIYEKVNFIHDDFKNYYFGDYEIIYCCNLVFSENDNKLLYQKLDKEFKGLFILFEYDKILSAYIIDKIKIKCSWNNSTEIYIFRK